MELANNVVVMLKGNQRVLSLLALEFDCSEMTIRRWIDKNDEMLTTAAALKIIAAETKVKKGDLLTESATSK